MGYIRARERAISIRLEAYFLSFHGNWVWRRKDHIDRKFMAKYRAPWR
jgi:hypothetical protein